MVPYEAQRREVGLKPCEVGMYVYLIESTSHPGKRYIGLTTNLKRRLAEHNEGKSSHTAKYKPWKVVVAVWFEDRAKAIKFERYLKSGSGHAFANRRFWPDKSKKSTSPQ